MCAEPETSTRRGVRVRDRGFGRSFGKCRDSARSGRSCSARFCMFLAALAFVWVGISVFQSGIAAARTLYVKGENVNVRSGPGTDTDVVTQLGRGRELKMIRRKGRWFEIEIADSDGTRGWIREDLLITTPPAPRHGRTGLEPPSMQELSSPLGVVEALDAAPRDKVLQAFLVAVRAAGQPCAGIAGLVRTLTKIEGVYYLVRCEPDHRYSVLVLPDGKMGTKVTPCREAEEVQGVHPCATG